MEDVADPQDRLQQGGGDGKVHPEVERISEILGVLRGAIHFDVARQQPAPFDRTPTLLTWTFSFIAVRLEKNSDHALEWIATPVTPSAAAARPGKPPRVIGRRAATRTGGDPRDVG